MQLYNDLTTIYKDCFFADCHVGDVLTIPENDGSPKVTGIEIHAATDLLLIKSDFLHFGTSKYYKDNHGKPEMQHDCDGILIVHYQNCDYLVLLELKSEYTKDNIEKAEKQLTTSYLRIIQHLLPFPHYNHYACKVCGVIVSLPVRVETLRDIRNKKNLQKDLSRFEKQICHFAKQNSPYLLEDKCIGLGNLPIHKNYIVDPFPIFHADAQLGSTTIDIYRFLRKL